MGDTTAVGGHDFTLRIDYHRRGERVGQAVVAAGGATLIQQGLKRQPQFKEEGFYIDRPLVLVELSTSLSIGYLSDPIMLLGFSTRDSAPPCAHQANTSASSGLDAGSGSSALTLSIRVKNPSVIDGCIKIAR